MGNYSLRIQFTRKYMVRPTSGRGSLHPRSNRALTPEAVPCLLNQCPLPHMPWPILRVVRQSQLSSSIRMDLTPFCSRYMNESCATLGAWPLRTVGLHLGDLPLTASAGVTAWSWNARHAACATGLTGSNFHRYSVPTESIASSSVTSSRAHEAM